MKKLLLSGICLVAFFATSQTTLYSEDFESGNSFSLNTADLGASNTYNTWLMNNTYAGGSGTFVCMGFPFSFTVVNTPTQPAGITNSPSSNYMHITAQAAVSSGITCASYIPADGTCVTDESNFSRMTAPISTTGYSGVSFDFWWLCGGSPQGFGEVYYSFDGGSTWILKQSVLNNVTNWTQSTLTDVAWDNQASLMFGFRFVNTTTATAADPAFSIDQVLITATAVVLNDITTTNDVTPASWCFNSTEAGTVNFNATGTFTAGNVYTAELSDAAGSFAAPTTIGTLASTANGNLSISTTMPAGTAVGTGYRVRVVSSAPATTGTDNTADLEIHALPTVNLPPFSDVCVNTPPFLLDQGTPAGGGYSGNGVVFGNFNAGDAGVGTHAITYTYFDGNGCEGSAMQLIGVDDCASINELDETSIVLFPNPTKSTFTLESESAVEQLEIVDISGKVVKSFGKNTAVYDVNSLNNGTYFVRIQTANGTSTIQLIKE